jgi:3-hydroxymyristoyl/3-hydroxydecanoyl-(acyl carrier protein) dehydratase
MTPEPEIRAVRRSGDAVEIDLHVPETLPLFADHFPRMGMLPGVVQVDWAVRCGVQHLGVAGNFRALRNLKFVNPIRPGADVTLRLARDSADSLTFEYRGARRAYSTGRVLFGAGDG